jgi:uncharacterized repeat protein (TIGR01451 family)/uncharacterized delta-60 repeat protein
VFVFGSTNGYNRQPIGAVSKVWPDGRLDSNFIMAPDSSYQMFHTAPSPSGKIVTASHFYSENISKLVIIRFLSEGHMDPTFTPFSIDGSISGTVIAVQEDEKIVVSAEYYDTSSTFIHKVFRLLENGGLDPSFHSLGTDHGYPQNYLLLQKDLKMIATGFLNPQKPNAWIHRFHEDGSLDTTFKADETIKNPNIEDIRITKNQELLIAYTFGGPDSTKANIVRLTEKGLLDTSFHYIPTPGVVIGGIVSGAPYKTRMYVNEDNSILVAVPTNNQIVGTYPTYFVLIKRLHPDGTIDTTFHIIEYNESAVIDICQLGNDKVLVVKDTDENFCIYRQKKKGYEYYMNTGKFYASIQKILPLRSGKFFVMSQARFFGDEGSDTTFYRLNADWTLDTSFHCPINTLTGSNYGASDPFEFLEMPNGKIVIGGSFYQVNDKKMNCLARLNENGSIDESFLSGLNYNEFYLQKIALQNGKLIVGGYYTGNNPGYSPYIRFYKVMDNGNLYGYSYLGVALGALVVQEDGKIVIGTSRTTYDDTRPQSIFRIDTALNVDPSFGNYDINGSGTQQLFIGNDGKIIAKGTFGSDFPNNLIRFYPDGGIDRSFKPISTTISGSPVTLDYDGGIVFMDEKNGSFQLRKIQENGQFDPSFMYDSVALDYHTHVPTEIYRVSDGFLTSHINILGTPYLDYSWGYRFGYSRFAAPKDERNKITGSIFQDPNKDCTWQLGEPRLSSVILTTNSGQQFASSDRFGNYEFLIDTGKKTFSVTQVENPQFLIPLCTETQVVNTYGKQNTFDQIDFADSVSQCALPYVHISTTRRRKCFKGLTTLELGNTGAIPSQHVTLKVVYPPYIKPISASTPWSFLNQDTLFFADLTIAPNEQKIITLVDSVSCGTEAILGLTQCTKAFLQISSSCEKPSPTIQLESSCDGLKSLFKLTNTGQKDMLDSGMYSVFINDTLVLQNTYFLKAGNSQSLRVQTGVNTVRLEADYSPNLAKKVQKMVFNEGCGAPTSQVKLGFVMKTYFEDLTTDEVTSCSEITGSHDPNDKQAVPSGYGNNHTVFLSKPIQYTIRFQNSGSDTAFNVKVIDTLDAQLDISTLSLLSASHPYQWKVTGTGRPVLTFSLDKIYLPAQSENELGSQGFIQFTIWPKKNAPLSSVIDNFASIYFDYNEAVVTNTVSLQLEDASSIVKDPSKLTQVELITGGSWNSLSSIATLVYPNPTQGLVMVDYSEQREAEIFIIDLSGKEAMHASIKTGKTILDLSSLEKGLYFFEIRSLGKIKVGKLLKQ